MPAKKPELKVMSASEARKHFAETVNDTAKGISRTIIEKSGVPVAAFISARDLERLQRLEAQWEADWKAVDEMRAAFADVDPEELERMALQTAAEARTEMRREREMREAIELQSA